MGAMTDGVFVPNRGIIVTMGDGFLCLIEVLMYHG